MPVRGSKGSTFSQLSLRRDGSSPLLSVVPDQQPATTERVGFGIDKNGLAQIQDVSLGSTLWASPGTNTISVSSSGTPTSPAETYIYFIVYSDGYNQSVPMASVSVSRTTGGATIDISNIVVNGATAYLYRASLKTPGDKLSGFDIVNLAYVGSQGHGAGSSSPVTNTDSTYRRFHDPQSAINGYYKDNTPLTRFTPDWTNASGDFVNFNPFSSFRPTSSPITLFSDVNDVTGNYDDNGPRTIPFLQLDPANGNMFRFPYGGFAPNVRDSVDLQSVIAGQDIRDQDLGTRDPTSYHGGNYSFIGAGYQIRVGDYSVGFGWTTTAGHHSFVTGLRNDVGDYSGAFGSGNAVGNNGFAAGGSNTVGESSAAFGIQNTAGNATLVSGYGNISGNASLVGGIIQIAGDSSLVGGSLNTVATESFAAGTNNTGNSDHCFLLGQTNSADQVLNSDSWYSITFGALNNNNGPSNTVVGLGITIDASTDRSTVSQFITALGTDHYVPPGLHHVTVLGSTAYPLNSQDFVLSTGNAEKGQFAQCLRFAQTTNNTPTQIFSTPLVLSRTAGVVDTTKKISVVHLLVTAIGKIYESTYSGNVDCCCLIRRVLALVNHVTQTTTIINTQTIGTDYIASSLTGATVAVQAVAYKTVNVLVTGVTGKTIDWTVNVERITAGS